MPQFGPFGWIRQHMTLTVPVAQMQGTGQVNLMLSKTLGFQCELEKVEIVTTVAGTGAGASQVYNVRKGNATGTVCGTVTATLANQGTMGTVTAGSVTGSAAVFGDGDRLTIERAAGGTAFTAGGVELLLTFRVRPQARA